MADDDEVDDQISFDPTFATAGPRRSTFTAPTSSTSGEGHTADAAAVSAPSEHDDDELAAALAADLTRIAPHPPVSTSPLPEPELQPEPEPTPVRALAPEPPHEAAPERMRVPEAEPDPAGPMFPPPVGDPVTAPFAVEPPVSSLPTPSARNPEAGAVPPLITSVPLPAPSPAGTPAAPALSSAESDWPGSAPWSSLPAPDPAQAVELPVPPDRPVRRSLPDEELLHIADDAAEHPGSTLDAIQQLEAQLRLREQEAREFQEWESTMRVLGTPDAIAAVEEARPEFFDVVAGAAVVAPITPTDAFVDPDASLAPWPVPAADDDAPPRDDAPPLEGGTQTRAQLDSAAPIVIASTPPLPTWEVPAPGRNWAPGPEFDFDPEPAPAVSDEIADKDAAGTPPEILTDPRFDAVVFADTSPTPVIEQIPPLIEPGLYGAAAVGWPPPAEISQTPSAGDTPERPEVKDAPADFYGAPMVVPVEVPPSGDDNDPQAVLPHEPQPESRDNAVVAGAVFSFDDLLVGPPDAATAEDDAQPFRAVAPAIAASVPLLIEPLPLAAGEPVPTDTGSITIVDQSYEEELPDDVDETDRAFADLGPVSVDTSGVAVVPGPIHPPSGPISTVRIPDDEVVLVDNEPVRMRAFSLEESGPEPTLVDHRVGRSARLFWLWFASNSSILSIGLGATVFAVGMSLRQSIVAVLAGVALSFIPLGLTTLAGKRSGQPTMVVSRATFGVVGNVVPAVLALVTRVYWGAVLLWLLASSVAIVLVGSGLDTAIGERQLLLISVAIAFLVALLVAFAGYPLFSRVQLVLSIVSGALIVGLIAFTWKYVNIGTALSTPDGSWVLTISGAVLVFSFVGLVWAHSGADLARYQRPGTSGAASMLWATFGTTLPTFALIGYGALLAASDPGIAKGFVLAPLDTIARMLPAWYPFPLIAATVLSLLSGVVLTLYSGGFALQAIGVRVRRQWSIVIVAVLLGALALVLTFGVTGGMSELFRDLATTLAVPTAAWAGIFGAEMMIRNRRFESDSLVRRGGIYADVRWVNLVALVLISAIGYGLTTATVTWLSWQGYAFTLLGMPLDSPLAASDLGVLVALAFGILTPLVAGVPAIRRQEAARA